MISVRTVTNWVLGAGVLLWLGACDGPLYSRILDGGATSIDALHIGVGPDGSPVATAADSGGSLIGVGGTGAGLGSGGSGQPGGASDTGNAITGGASGEASTGGMGSGTGGAGTGGAGTGGAATGGAATGGRATGGAATGGAATGGQGTGGAGTGGASTGGAPGDAAQYGFETSTQSWGVAAGGQPLTSVDVSTAQRFEGTSSLAVAVTTTAGGSTHYVEVAPPTPAIPPSAQVTFHVFIPASAPLTAIEPYLLETGTYRYTARKLLAASLRRDAWTTIRVSVPANAAAILRLGVKLEASGPWTGTVYIDRIGW